MKYLAIIALLTASAFSHVASAQTDYSGVYLGTSATTTNYFSVHHNTNDNSIIVALLDMNSENWTATGGSLSGHQADTSSIFESGTFSLNIDFNFNQPVVTVTQCELRARVRCFRDYEEGAKFTLFKILP
ncbi:MAG: hypothetical protein CMQ34_09750 [Gammaproteobacteria bacterium]|nr:hypothetical protein [Gammaproteobacteria bacterium]|tara:strand:- start:732 stop:1121 length:390 start_codon:yes stop_codon:yes gene_type:complete